MFVNLLQQACSTCTCTIHVPDVPSEEMIRQRQQANAAASSVPCGDAPNKEGSSVDPPEFNKAI